MGAGCCIHENRDTERSMKDTAIGMSLALIEE
jgi:hypothetical protein